MDSAATSKNAENPAKKNGAPGGKDRSKGGGYSGKPQSYLPDIHRSLPSSLDAEKGVLCSILLSPGEVLGECIERIDEKHFHLPSHETIYLVLVELWKESKPIDLITLTQSLKDRNILDQVGGAAAVSDLFTFVPTAANVAYYLDILKEKFLLRQIIGTCTEYAARSYEEQGDVRMLLDEVEANILAIGEERFKGSQPDMKAEVMKAIDSLEKLMQNRGGIAGLPTGFKKLDQMTSGLHPAEMFVIAARPSMGKTALAMNIAEHVAVETGKAVGVFSLEMSTTQLVQRMLCSLARVNLENIRNGFPGKQDIPRIAAAAERLSNSKIYIDDTAGLSILELRAKARRMKDRFGIDLIVIDYLQLLKSTSRRAQENRQIEIAEISSGVKALAKELKVPIIVLAQLNREPEKREGGKPRLSDLRESGSIEQDADVVALLVRSAYYEKDEEASEDRVGEAELIIAKQRNGPTGDIPLTFLSKFTRFESRSERSEDA